MFFAHAICLTNASVEAINYFWQQIRCDFVHSLLHNAAILEKIVSSERRVARMLKQYSRSRYAAKSRMHATSAIVQNFLRPYISITAAPHLQHCILDFGHAK